MYIPEVELHQATTLEEAATLMARHGPDARLLAGGTDLLVDLKTGRVAVQPPGLPRPYRRTARRRRDGSGPAHRRPDHHHGADRIDARRRESFTPILDAATRMAAPTDPQHGHGRRQRLLCGTVRRPATDPDGHERNRSCCGPRGASGRCRWPSFYAGPRETHRRDDEVLTAVQVPSAPPGFGAAYARFAQRDGNAIAVAGVAASLLLDESGIVQESRMVLNAVAPTAKPVAAGGTDAGRQPARGRRVSSRGGRRARCGRTDHRRPGVRRTSVATWSRCWPDGPSQGALERAREART